MKLRKREIIVVVVLVLGLCLWAFWPKSEGATVTVTVDGETVMTLPLSRSGVYAIDGYGGFSLNLVLEQGKAHVEDSTCPDLICQNHSPIAKAGQQIVCLPGRVVITVAAQEEGLDASTG